MMLCYITVLEFGELRSTNNVGGVEPEQERGGS